MMIFQGAHCFSGLCAPGKLLDNPSAHGFERLAYEDFGTEHGQELAELDGRERHRARQLGRRHGDGVVIPLDGGRSEQFNNLRCKTIKAHAYSPKSQKLHNLPICFVFKPVFLLFYSPASADFQESSVSSLKAINREIFDTNLYQNSLNSIKLSSKIKL